MSSTSSATARSRHRRGYERAEVQLGGNPSAEDPAERAGVLEERRDEHEERRVHEERLEALLDREPGDDVDRAREHEHREPTRGRCGAGAAAGRARSRRAPPRPTTAHRRATIGVTHARPTRYVARKSAGSVTMSPAAVTIGAATLSRSQLRRTRARRDRDGDRHHDDRREEPADHRDHDEVGDRDRVLEAEAHRDRLGEDREHERDRQRQRDRRRQVLADDGVGPGATCWKVPVWIAVPSRLPERPEHVARACRWRRGRARAGRAVLRGCR